MGKRSKRKKSAFFAKMPTPSTTTPPPQFLLDYMKDGQEYLSLVLGSKNENTERDATFEIRHALQNIETILGIPVLCVVGNMYNPILTAAISIDFTDNLPFSEMVDSVPSDKKEVAIILVTPGGIAQQVAKFVEKLRTRFDKVYFLLPDMAMSAGTIFAMSGNKIIMTSSARIGPIDPQIPDKNGRFVPAQALLTLIEDIKKRGNDALALGNMPDWADVRILDNIDYLQLGNIKPLSDYSIMLVKDYLKKYKFSEWVTHTSDGSQVSEDDKERSAERIAKFLCDHSSWKSHSRGITREEASSSCKIKIEHAELTPGLDKGLRRFWALMYFFCERTVMLKVFISSEYSLFRSDLNAIRKQQSLEK